MATTAYDFVIRLRPNWLRPTAPGSMGGGTMMRQVTLVYLDDTRMGSLEALRQIEPSQIRSIRYLSATRAAIVLRDTGSEPISGAIVVSTKD